MHAFAVEIPERSEGIAAESGKCHSKIAKSLAANRNESLLPVKF